jgi:predicted RNA-binding Zn-ribbon protein involved in translation (DUF1610 family)
MAQKIIRRFKCPSCAGENTLRKSRSRNSKEKLLQLVAFLKIYKCKKCGWRGWKINFSMDAKMIKKIALYFLLVLIAALVVYNLLKLVV